MSNIKKKHSIIKIDQPSILKAAEEHSAELEVKNKKSGRKALPIEEKASERVTLLLTPKELAAFEKKSGRLANGTYLKNYLLDETDLLND